MKIEMGKYYNIRGEYGIVYTVHVIGKSFIPLRYLCTWINISENGSEYISSGYKWSWRFIAEVQ